MSEDARIRAALPTVRHARARGARALVLASPLGRPKGGPEPKLSLAPIARRLAALLGEAVPSRRTASGAAVERQAGALPPGGVLLLENLRFHPGEEANDPAFAQALARLGDVYVDDAFAAAHRAHASTEGITQHLRPAVAGLLMKQELTALARIFDAPARPLVAILGGAKVSEKLALIESLLGKVDRLLVGGGMAFTFLRAQGHEVGRSLLEANLVDTARRLLERPGRAGSTSACRWTRSWRPRPTRRRAGWSRAMRSPRISWASTSARRPCATSPRRSATAGPSSGTGRWASSSGARSRPAPSVSRGPSRTRRGLTVVGGGDSVAAVQAAGRRRPHRVPLDRRRRVPRVPGGPHAARRGRPGRRLMADVAVPRTPVIAGNWKMHTTLAEARALAAAVRDGCRGLTGHRRRGVPAVHGAQRGGRGARRLARPARRAGRALGDGGRLHGRGLAARSGTSAARVRHPRPLRAPPRASARPTRSCGGRSRRRSRHGLTPLVCVGETLDERDGRADARGGRPAARRAPSAASRPARSRRCVTRLRAGVGDRHRADGDARPRPHEVHARIRARARPAGRRGARRGVPHPLRRQRQARQRRAS